MYILLVQVLLGWSFWGNANLNFPKYQNFNNATEAYNDFIQKIMVANSKVAPIKEKRAKHTSQE